MSVDSQAWFYGFAFALFVLAGLHVFFLRPRTNDVWYYSDRIAVGLMSVGLALWVFVHLWTAIQA